MMLKKIYLIAFLLFSSNLSAQSSGGAIYFFSLRVDPELTEYVKSEDKSKTWFSGFSISDAWPEQLLDSLKKKTEDAYSLKLGMPVILCFAKNKKGEDIGSVGMEGQIEGLPPNTFNKGKQLCPENIRFIYLDAQIYASGGRSIILGGEKRTKLKPRVQLSTKVYDQNKNEIWQNKVADEDFASLRSITKYYGTYEETRAQTFTPYDIYAMYLSALDDLLDLK